MQNILLLHGAIGSAEQLEPLKTHLEKECVVHTFNFSGHGGKPANSPFSIENFAHEVIAFLDERNLDRISVFGYSMGGYVALYLARHYPERIESVITLATKFRWDPTIAEKEIQMLNSEKILEKLPAFAEILRERHSPVDWQQTLASTRELLTALGQNNVLKQEDYKAIECNCLVLLGDRDKMITFEETLEVYKALPNARMGMLPFSGHPIEQTNLDALAFLITQFLSGQRN